MTTYSISPKAMQRQVGAALITGLIFLVVLTMIGVTAARMSTLEERMSGNMRDRSLAMQAAEMALRDAERDILGLGAAPRNPAISGITGFDDECTDGLCDRRGLPPSYDGSVIKFPEFTASGVDYDELELDIAVNGVAYGDYTGSTNITGIPDNQQPRYVIEGMRKLPSGGGEAFYYRITVRAQGANPNTVVWLQEVFKP